MSQPGASRAQEPGAAAREKAARPPRWRVILLNDDYTTMEFVVHVLEAVFRHSPAEATQIMLRVHKEGQGVAGIFPHEVAETKLRIVHDKARAAGFPLKGKLEKE